MSAKSFYLIFASIIAIRILGNTEGSRIIVVSTLAQKDCNVSESSGKITGKIFDAVSLTPFPTGHIFIMKSPKWVEPADKAFYFDSSNVALVDQKAEFEFSSLPVGYYSLKTHIIGCPQTIDSVYISRPGQIIKLNLSIIPLIEIDPPIVRADPRKENGLITTIRGKIISTNTGRPLENAKITLLKTGQYSLTNANGEYEINKVKDRGYTITIDKPGYFTVKHLGVHIHVEKKKPVTIWNINGYLTRKEQ